MNNVTKIFFIYSILILLLSCEGGEENENNDFFYEFKLNQPLPIFNNQSYESKNKDMALFFSKEQLFDENIKYTNVKIFYMEEKILDTDLCLDSEGNFGVRVCNDKNNCLCIFEDYKVASEGDVLVVEFSEWIGINYHYVVPNEICFFCKKNNFNINFVIFTLNENNALEILKLR